jgi:hypothetical protein
MNFNCAYCGNRKTQTIFPNVSSYSNQDKIMNGIMVCDSHKQKAVNKLVSLKMYVEAK